MCFFESSAHLCGVKYLLKSSKSLSCSVPCLRLNLTKSKGGKKELLSSFSWPVTLVCNRAERHVETRIPNTLPLGDASAADVAQDVEGLARRDRALQVAVAGLLHLGHVVVVALHLRVAL